MSTPTAPGPQSNLPEYSVSELSKAVKRTVEDAFGYIRVRGELSQPKVVRSGHFYGRLKDETAVVDVVCWRSVLPKLAIKPEEGMEVVCTGRMTTYAGRSQYQLIIESMELAGEGALLKLLEERKQRLAAEGLFAEARKQPLPFLPEVVGVVSSPTGAVIRDILHRLADRFPRHVLLWPVAVQGDGAAEQIVAAIDGFNALTPASRVPRPDVLIVGRGGGSLEDLMAFNDESVVRAIVASRIPVIAAVGHETDTTLADYAADKRAPTPTAAAEHAVPVRSELIQTVLEHERRLMGGMSRLLASRQDYVAGLARGLGDPRRVLDGAYQRLEDRSERLDQALRTRLARQAERVAALGGRLRDPRQQLGDRRRQVAEQARALAQAGRTRLRDAHRRLDAVAGRLSDRTIRTSVARGQERSRELGDRLARAQRQRLAAERQRLDALAGRLHAVSYEAVLERGFVLVRDGAGRPVKRAHAAEPGQRVSLAFYDDRRDAVLTGEETPAPGDSAAQPGQGRDRGRRKRPQAPPAGQGTLF